jgi:beta-glucosidase
MQYVNFPSFERNYKAPFFEYVNAFKFHAEDPVVPIFVESSQYTEQWGGVALTGI